MLTRNAVLQSQLPLRSLPGPRRRGRCPTMTVPEGEGSLEVYAELTAVRHRRHHADAEWPADHRIPPVLPDADLGAGRHAERRSQVEHAVSSCGSGLLQSCRNPDGSFLPPVNGRYDFCIDWVLGFHADANGILWILDSASRPTGPIPRTRGRPRCMRSTSGGTPSPTRCTRSSTSTR